MNTPRDIESEFGVPFPGRILPRDRWTRTGYRDPGVPFDWQGVFGRDAARVVDLGCGNGRYLIASSLARPELDHLGIDLVQVAIDFAARRANRRGLTSVRFVVGDAVTWMSDRLRMDSVDEVHVYHPQPYYDPAERARRLLTPEFLERTWAVLRRGGKLVLQSDNKAYWKYLLRAVQKHFDPEALSGPWPDAPRGRTRREIQAQKKGLVVWRMQARKRDIPLDIAVPSADFDADRPHFQRLKGG
ncbi:MAG: hypothetical protein A2Z34_08790 [Planctomycetes bacterium RBG_16_59_8]|nr:MAG: hypothetical protein A2Z34_08790 [Planctomycetes bacterium RBG_16_59_8]